MNKTVNLSEILEEELLNLRICDLPVRIEGTWLEECIAILYQELETKGIRFRPPFYLADEWLTPDQEPVVGIPFYLADPVLTRLERKMMLEAEGETKEECMKLLRHETGHAINYAYKLFKKKKWQNVFGRFSSDYPDTYKFRPHSKSFVRHLEGHYAQYHPDEDFTETFAVWLTPGLDWRNSYHGWKALHKLEYVDELMGLIKDKVPVVKKGKKYWQVSRLRVTLKSYYKKKRKIYAQDFPDFHDPYLKKIFAAPTENNKQFPKAVAVLKKNKNNIINNISVWTGEKKYIVDDLFKKIIQRTRELELVAADNERDLFIKLSSYITTLIMNYMYTGWFHRKK